MRDKNWTRKQGSVLFVGYGTKTKGYRLYDPKRARVFYSRDVVFNESNREVEKEPNKQGGKRYVKFDCLSEEEKQQNR